MSGAVGGKSRETPGGTARRGIAEGRAVLRALAGCLALGMALAAGRARAAEVVAVVRAEGLPSDWITCLAAGGDTLWAGTGDAGVAALSPAGRVERTFGAGGGIPSARAISVAVFGGKVFLGTDKGIGIYDGRSWESLGSVARVNLGNAFLRAEPGGGALWAGAVNLAGGLLRYDGTRWSFMGGKNRGLLNHVQAFAFTDGEAWLGSSTSGIYRLSGDAFDQFRAGSGLPSANTICLETFRGALWAGTSAGAARRENGRFVPYTRGGGFPLKAVFCMAASPEALYLGGREGLVRYRAGRFETFVREGVSLGRVNALLWRDGTLYAGTGRGLFLIRGW